MMDLFVDCLFKPEVKSVHIKEPHFVAVKVPQFSFSRLKGADPKPHVEMASTGEVACFGKDVEEAYLKGFLAVGGRMPQKGIFISLAGEEKKDKFLRSIKQLAKLELPLYATDKTYKFLKKADIPVTKVDKIQQRTNSNVLTLLREGKVDLVINIVDRNLPKDMKDGYAIRRGAIDNNVALFTKIKNARLFIDAISKYKLTDLEIKSWGDYEK